MIDIGRLVHLLIVRYNAHDVSENLASITAGEARLHCVRNNNTFEFVTVMYLRLHLSQFTWLV